MSFGYRYGLPADADLVFDVRFLPNPHFVPKLRKYSGRDPRVAKYIRSFPQTDEFLAARRGNAHLSDSAHYIREGKSYLTIAFSAALTAGGVGHRSVMMAESVRKTLHKKGIRIQEGGAPRFGEIVEEARECMGHATVLRLVKKRVAVWTGLGLLVGCLWVSYALVTAPDDEQHSAANQAVQAVAYISCPSNT